MNELTAAVKKQIESCRELLNIFQAERRLYIDRPEINLDDVTRILCRKKQLVDIFDQQHSLIRQLKEKNAGGPADPEDREMLRELGSILEQLLVIDCENEKLLRQCLTTRNPIAAAIQAETPVTENKLSLRNRPALQRQLPFIPGAVPAAPLTAQPRIAPKATPATVPAAVKPAANPNSGSARTGARHLIRNYVQTANLLNLNSKYA